TTGGFLTLTNTTTFAAGSAYTLASSFELVLGTGQSGLSNLALTMTGNASVHGGIDNTTNTIGLSGSVLFSTSGVAYVGSTNGQPLGVSRSLTNVGLIDNTGTGSILVVPSGGFTNQGTVRATSGSVDF